MWEVVLVEEVDDWYLSLAGTDPDSAETIGAAIDTSLDALQTVPPAPDGSAVPAAVVVMSDGTTTMGVPNETAAQRAVEEGVPVSTIAFGTENGTVTIPGSGELVRVPVDAEALAAFQLCAELEGIIPALESAHAIAKVGEVAQEVGKGGIVTLCLSGRGDKDVGTVAAALGRTI